MRSKLEPPVHAQRSAQISEGTILRGQGSRPNYRWISDVDLSPPPPPPPADSPPRDCLTTMVKRLGSTVFEIRHSAILQIFGVVLFSVVSVLSGLPKLKRHLNEKNTWSDRSSIHGHRNFY